MSKEPITRPTHTSVASSVAKQVNSYHNEVLQEIITHLEQDDVVVVGMAWNPFVKKACKLLRSKNIQHTYLEYGSYLSQWKPRLAIKMWSGWPTFPQVFVKGTLIGGFQDLEKSLTDNTFHTLLNGDISE